MRLDLLKSDEHGSATNASRALTHSSDSSREGLAVNATHNSPERWLPVVGYEGYYEVSSAGRVRSVDRMVDDSRGGGQHLVRGQERKLQTIQSGHKAVSIYRNGNVITAKVHRLVLTAFVGPAPEGTECCHNNGDPTDNRVENLRWDTRSENHRDCVNHGTHPNASKTHCIRGHEFTPDNIYRKQSGARQCRTCSIEFTRRTKAARRAARQAAA